jgi:hypothetical protein
MVVVVVIEEEEDRRQRAMYSLNLTFPRSHESYKITLLGQ